MPTIQVEETVNVGREALFDVLTDHEKSDRFRGVQSCTLIQEGTHERNGLGAVRRVKLGGPALLDEAIVVFERPEVYEYRIVRSRPFPIKHTLGRVELEALGANRTKVTWTSTFEVSVPVVGKRIGNHAAPQFARLFRSAIHTAAKAALDAAA